MHRRGRVILVGYHDQDNLGLRYLSAQLRRAGHTTRLAAITDDQQSLIEQIRRFQPDVVGFSLIFQFYLPQYAALMRALRSAGITAHFTIGGHYPSFEPAKVLEGAPELDSVVRYEGEITLLELTERILASGDWRGLANVASRSAAGPRLSPIRQGTVNLDEFAWPDRDDICYEEQDLPTASVIGGRGCPWRCSFCSIITFYEQNGTKGRRRRDPRQVVDELEFLHRERHVRVILWQDDDFLAGGRAGVRWAHAVAEESVRRGLHENLRWKISCRSDEVRPETIEPLVEAGLTHIYMGVESGDRDSLRHLNKHLDPETHLRAAETLRDHSVSFDFGFMLLEPWSTVETVRNNIAFLRDFARGGVCSVNFGRTLPYAGTPIEARLRQEGRLIERDFDVDYSFLDPRLDVFYDWAMDAFTERNHGGSGTASLLRLLLFEAQLDLPDRPRDAWFLACSRQLTDVSNRLLLDTTESGLEHIAARGAERGLVVVDPVLLELAQRHRAEDRRLREDVRVLARRRPEVAMRVGCACWS